MDTKIKAGTKNEVLADAASQILSSDILEKLIEWYNEILDFDAQYIVFLVRRCYVLALILEPITGRKMVDAKNKKFLTDSSGLLQIDMIYQDYRSSGGKTPTVLLVDDILVHGRNINNLIKTFYDRLYTLAQKDSKRTPDDLKDKIEQELLRTIRISVFYCTDKPLLLNEQFWPILHEQFRVGDKDWRRLSNNLSTLITYSSVTNASYVFSRRIDSEKFDAIKSYFLDYEKTRYRNNTEYTKIEYIVNPEHKILAISTLRLVENNADHSFRVVPFLFFPELSQAETSDLVDRIDEAGYKKTALNKWLAELDLVPGRRMSNELLTMVLSNIVLNDFMSRIEESFPRVTDVFDEADEEVELTKLARNYNSSTFRKTYNKLKTIINNRVVRFAELEKIVTCVVKDRDELMEDFGKQPALLTEDQRIKITYNIEDRIYNQGLNDEQEAQWIADFPFYDTPFHFRRKNIPCYETFKALYQYGADKTINERALLDYSIRIFLQMMDCGVIAVSSYPPVGKEIDGLMQYEKAGEQAMTLLPVRYLLYLPMLSRMELVAKAKQIPLREEAEKYFSVVPLEDDCFDEADILEFADRLADVNQSVSDWNDNYVNSAPYLRTKKGTDDTVNFYLKQHELVMTYVENYRKYR